jgi:hypothetical protein
MALPVATLANRCALSAGLLILRLTTIGVAGLLVYGERPVLALVAIGVAAVTAVIGTWHHRLLPLCHVLATGVWAGCMAVMFWNHHWVMGVAMLLLCGIETSIGRMEVKAWTFR